MEALFFLIWFIGALWIGWRAHAGWIRGSRYTINARDAHPVNRILRRF